MYTISAGQNAGQTIIDDSWFRDRDTIDQGMIDRWQKIGGSNVFSQVNGQWWGDRQGIENIKRAVANRENPPPVFPSQASAPPTPSPAQTPTAPAPAADPKPAAAKPASAPPVDPSGNGSVQSTAWGGSATQALLNRAGGGGGAKGGGGFFPGVNRLY